MPLNVHDGVGSKITRNQFTEVICLYIDKSKL